MDYRIGSIIEYSTYGGGMRRVRVGAKDDDVKNGQPGFDAVEMNTGKTVWGYDSQIIRVVEY